MDKQEVIKVLKRAISNLSKNRNNDAIYELQQLKTNLEKIVKEDDSQNYLSDECN